MYHPYLSEQLSGEKETEFQNRADQARGIRKAGRTISGLVIALLVTGMLAAACGAGPVGVEDDAAARQTVHAAERQAMLDQVIAELIRNNGPYLEHSTAVEAPVTVQPSLVPLWIIEPNGPYAARSQQRAWLVPPWLPGANGPYAEEENTAKVPANVR